MLGNFRIDEITPNGVERRQRALLVDPHQPGVTDDVSAQDGRKTVLDPGIGFGKTPEQSLAVIARLSELKTFGLPLLLGASRKRFIDKVSPAPPDQRQGGSIAANLLAVAGGSAIIRTHDVAETVQALKVMAAIEDHE